MAKAIWKGAVIAESDQTEIVEGNHYFPPIPSTEEYLKPSETQRVPMERNRELLRRGSERRAQHRRRVVLPRRHALPPHKSRIMLRSGRASASRCSHVTSACVIVFRSWRKNHKEIASKKKKPPTRAPEAISQRKSRTLNPALGRNGNPARVRAILQKLNEAYPDVTCALKHENAFQLLDLDDTFGAVHRRAREHRDCHALPEVSQRRKHLRMRIRTNSSRTSARRVFSATRRNRSWARAKKIVEEFRGEVPKTMEELLTLPGVARKTANVVLGTAFGIASGVVVDTHVMRLSGRLDLTKNTDPKKIEQDLMQMIPQDRWILFSHQLIWHGRRVCQARKPKCIECNLERHLLFQR